MARLLSKRRTPHCAMREYVASRVVVQAPFIKPLDCCLSIGAGQSEICGNRLDTPCQETLYSLERPCGRVSIEEAHYVE